jgi:hypothetical protein
MRRGSGPSELANARFDGAQFSGDACFDRAQFSGDACFDRAQFSGDACFDRAQFSGDACFDRAQFSGEASFCNARFNRVRLVHGASFRDARFLRDAWFNRARFCQLASFRDARFLRDAWFNRARFCQLASFRGARFLGNARFMGAQFDDDARLEEAHLAAEHILGPVLVKGRLALDETTVDRHLVVEAFACRFTCIATEFKQGATIRLRWADVVLDHCIFGQPTTISFAQLPFRKRPGGLTPEVSLGPELFTMMETELKSRVRYPKPRLLSMRGADVSNLTLVELDLSQCMFQGAHKGAELRIVGARPFADTPNQKSWIPLWRRFTHRQVLAEEHWYRSHRDRKQGSTAEPLYESSDGRKGGWDRPNYESLKGEWNRPEDESLKWLADRTGQDIERLTPDGLASVYRALRKAQEDNKNEPGAADFYYGEMEMRRHSDGGTGLVERLILTGYWLISGYALRAWRALAWLAVVLALATVAIMAVGLKPPPTTDRIGTITSTAPGRQTIRSTTPKQPARDLRPWSDRLVSAVLVAIGGAVFRETGQELTTRGKLIQDALRLLGPLLLGLALVSVRNRIKR